MTADLNHELLSIIRHNDSIFDFVHTHSHDGVLYQFSDKRDDVCPDNNLLKIIGYTRELSVNSSLDFIHEDDRVKLFSIPSDSISSSPPIIRCIHKDKTLVYLQSSAISFERKGVKCKLFLFKDKTEIINFQAKVSQLEEQYGALTNKYNTVYHNTPLAFQTLDADGIVLDVNAQWKKALGYSEEEAVGLWFGDLLHPEDQDIFKKRFERFLTTRSIQDVNFRVRRKNGRFIHAAFEGCVAEVKEGESTCVYCAFKDVTKDKELRKRESVYRHLFEQLNMGIVRLSMSLEILQVNNKFCDIIGYSQKEVLKMQVSDFTHPDDRNFTLAKITSVADCEITEYSLEKRYIHKDGHVVWVHLVVNIMCNKYDQDKYIVGSIVDISEAKKSEELLRINVDRYEKSQLQGNVANWEYNVKDDTFWASDQAKRIYGFSLDDDCFSSDMVESCIVERERVHQALVDLIQDNTPYNLEFDLVSRDEGKLKTVVSIAELETDANGEPYLVAGTVHDITVRKGYEKKIVEQNREYEQLHSNLRKTNELLIIAKDKAEEANKLKTEFLQNMSHEIRSPMNGVVGFSELMCEEKLDSETYLQYASIVKNSSHQLLHVIDDILEISRLETKIIKPNNESFSLNSFIMEMFAIFNFESSKRRIPLYVKKSLPDDQCYIISDKMKLSKIISNLLENAFKFTSSGSIELGYTTENSELIIYVKDTGIGISEEGRERIFMRFSQEDKSISNDYGGLGLGLSISAENASIIGGTIDFESVKGEGTTFLVKIPLVKDMILNAEVKHLEQEPYLILVAEDEEINYMYIEALLKKKKSPSYRLIHAKNGQEAVDICQTNRDINLVLMDIKMPVMNGYDATKQIKKISTNLPVIAQTAYSTPGDVDLAFKNGCDDFISKPIDAKFLFTLINKHIKLN